MPACGNGVVEGSEGCDDGPGTPVGGDGCSALCVVEPGHYFEVEPNDDGTPSTGGGTNGNDFTGALGNANGLFDANVVIHARLSPAGDEDLFALRNDTTQTTSWSLTVNITEPGQTCADHDTFLNVRDGAGAVLARLDDGPSGSLCPIGTIQMPPLSVVYLQVLQFLDATAVPRYTLTLTRTAVCGDGVISGPEACDDSQVPSVAVDGCSTSCQAELIYDELEPNQRTPFTQVFPFQPGGNDFTMTTFNGVPWSPELWLRGSVAAGGDEDIFKIQLGGATTFTVSVRVELFGPNAGACAGDTYLVVRDVAGNILQTDDDDGDGVCSLVNRLTIPVGSTDFYVQVLGFNDGLEVPAYAARVDIGVCGNLVREPSEECDGTPGCQANCALATVCGNGVVEYPETCDHGRLPPVGNSACTAQCVRSFADNELEPNDDGFPDTAGGPLGNDYPAAVTDVRQAGNETVLGYISVPGDEDTFRFINSTGNSLWVDLDVFTGAEDACDNNLAMVVRAPGLLEPFGAGGTGACPRSNAYLLGDGSYVDVTVLAEDDISTFAGGYQLRMRASVCGNGVREDREDCDGSPGCTVFCRMPGLCGNGIREFFEFCDDAQVPPLSGDGCSRRCAAESAIPEFEPNDDGAVAVAEEDFVPVSNSGPWTPDVIFQGALSPAGDEDVVALRHSSTGDWVVTATTDNGVQGPCVAGTDTVLYVRDAFGAQLGYSDDAAGLGLCSSVTFTLPAGQTLYVQVADFGDNEVIGSYRLVISAQGCGNGILEPGEICDGTPGCNSSCFPEANYATTVAQGQECVGLKDVTLFPPGGDDTWSATTTLPALVGLYGLAMTQVRLGTNGYLQLLPGGQAFDGAQPRFTNSLLPIGPGPGIIAPFWDDLFQPDHGAWLLGTADVVTATGAFFTRETAVVAQWAGSSMLASSSELSFQVVMFPSGAIHINYCSMTGVDPLLATGGSATVGLEAFGGSAFQNVWFNESNKTTSGRRVVFVRQ